MTSMKPHPSCHDSLSDAPARGAAWLLSPRRSPVFLGQVCEPGRDPRCGLTGPRGSGLEGPARFTDGPGALCPRGRAGGLCGSGWPSACRACPKPLAVFIITAARRGSWQREPRELSLHQAGPSRVGADCTWANGRPAGACHPGCRHLSTSASCSFQMRKPPADLK